MKEKLTIAKKPCKFCGGLISWKKVNDKWRPIHVDKEGFLLGDGSCPHFKKSQVSLVSTPSFNRFDLNEGDAEYSLPIFQGKTPLIPRFYISKITLELDILKKIIKIPQKFSHYNIWGLAHGLTRSFLEERKIVSFFRISESDDPKEHKFIHFFIVPFEKIELQNVDEFIISTLDKKIEDGNFTEDFIINKEFSKDTITPENIIEYVRNIKTFFDGLLYHIRYKMKDGEFRTTTHHDLIGNDLYFFVDLDTIFYGEGKQATTKDEGKYIFGALKDKNRRYRLIKITSTPVTSHLNTPQYAKFIEYSRSMFENKGFPSKKAPDMDWNINEYWEKINDVKLPEYDRITIVEDKNEKQLFFPLSRLFKGVKKDIPRDLRFNSIQNAKQELQAILTENKQRLVHYSPSIEILLLERIIPRYHDLAKYPIHIEFAENKTVQIERDVKNPYRLDRIPQELLKGMYGPIAGKFNFLIIPIVPKNLKTNEFENIRKLVNDIKQSFSDYGLSDNIQVNDSIKYTFNRDDIYHRKQNKWGTVFDTQITPKLIEINNQINTKDIIVLPLIGLRDMGNSSRLFKYYMQNEFYKLLRIDLSKNHFGVIQSFLVDEYNPYKGSKLAAILYKNNLFNIAANCPQSTIARRIKNGILFKFKFPFGTKDISNPITSIGMQAGFDASKVIFVEDSKPRGAVIVTLDPYGKQVRSKYIRDAHTHKGLISENVLKDLIVEILHHQQSLLGEFAKVEITLPKKIIFLFDGDINVQQKALFIKVYNELIESGEYPILPEFSIFEVLKSHPLRMYLLEESDIEDIPFGVMALLNDNEFVIKSHIWDKRTMAQPQLYRFKMRLSQRYKHKVQYDILDIELINIAVQLFQSTLFNTGKSGRPLKESFVIHESHKLSQEFASKPESIGLLYYKD